MIRSSLSCWLRVRYSVSGIHFFYVSQRCSAHYCIELLPISSSSSRSWCVNSQLFQKREILSKRIHEVHNSRMWCHTYADALAEKSSSYDLKLRRKDEISNDFALIYRVPEVNFFRIIYTFTYIILVLTPLTAIASLYKDYQYEVDVTSTEIMEDAGNDPFMLTDKEFEFGILLLHCVSVSFFIFLRRFPLRIYYNGKSYIAIFMNSFFPLLNTKHVFSSAKKHTVPSIFRETFYILGKRRARLFGNYFRRPIDQMKMAKEFSMKN